MKKIPLTQGMVAIVDDEDYEGLARFKWYGMISRRTCYAVRSKIMPNGKQRTIRMHRVILDTPPEYQTDHVNGNGLDNRKENLRVAMRAQNLWNRGKQRNNTSGYKGVLWRKDRHKWIGRIKVNKKQICLGLFADKFDAVKAYNEAAKKYHGEFARLNEALERCEE